MYFIGVSLVIAVGVLNICFNSWARAAATESSTWMSGIFSYRFAAAFIIGCISLLALYTLYRSGINLGRAILLMGATSIVGGTIYGTITSPKQTLDASEYAILVLIAAFFVYRMAIKPWPI